jgi:hypothetical protein
MIMQNVLELRPLRQQPFQIDSRRYAKCIEVSRRVRWDIERDVIRGRRFDFSQKFLPEALSRVPELDFLWESEKRLLSHVQGRTYANMFGLVERFIGAKILELSHEHSLGDQNALEALIRFTDEELKHQELFRRIERLIAEHMPDGYEFVGNPNDVARLVLGKSTWAVLALTCMIELFSQEHYRASIGPDADVSPLFKDVFLFHWKEESQHAILDELEWRREDAELTPRQRDDAVNDVIALVAAVDALVQRQAAVDAEYFFRLCTRAFSPEQVTRVRSTVLRAYRWQYILSGAENARFTEVLAELVTAEQAGRIGAALTPIAAGH